MTVFDFGSTPDGRSVKGTELRAGRLSARVIEWGAVLQDLHIDVNGTPRRIVLGLPTLADYIAYSPHMGAIAGRYAMRIRDGRFTLDGAGHQLTLNGGKHHVHGGAAGFGKRPWAITGRNDRSVQLELLSPDGDEGYPGALSVSCVYSLGDDDRLTVELTATTTKATVLNLVHHSYFDLSGTGEAGSGRLEIPATERVETDAEGLPTGNFLPVAGTPFDFSTLRPLPAEPVDATYVLSLAPVETPRLAATIVSPQGDLRMDVLTTEPGIHFYDGGKLAVPVAGLNGSVYAPRAGICLEPHRFADAPNHPGFPNTVLRPGETYRQTTIFAFRTTDR